MKVFSIFVLLIAHLTMIGQNKVTINGVFTNTPPASKITLENYVNPKAFKQTANISDKKFSFSFNAAQEEIYKLSFSKQNYIALVINTGENIELTLNPDKLGDNPIIKGSPGSEFVYTVQSKIFEYNKALEEIKGRYYSTEESKRSQVEAEYNTKEAQKNEYIAAKVKEKKESLAALFFIEMLSMDKYISVYEEVDATLNKKFPEHLVVISLHNKISSNKYTAIGAKAPDFTQSTPEDKELNLYSIKNAKIIIVDFWASWCKPCRAENPKMVSLYADYHKKGLEIFGVSLDKTKGSWVKAIKSDNLTWAHVSDLKGWKNSAANLYGVRSIPSMFVIDGTNFKILAKNLRGQELRNFISSKLD